MELGAISKEEIKQMTAALDTIMQQNYFTYNNAYYKPQKGVAMGSPLSGTLGRIILAKVGKALHKTQHRDKSNQVLQQICG